MADLPGMYSHEAHNPYSTQRVERAAGAAGAAGAAHQAPLAGALRFFFMEAESSSGLESFMRIQSNMDVIVFAEERNGGKFWWLNDTGEDDGTYMTGIRITGTYGGASTLQVQITTCNNDFETTKQGYMTASQYKKLAVFVIAKSGSTDLLGDPIGDHIRFRMHNRFY